MPGLFHAPRRPARFGNFGPAGPFPYVPRLQMDLTPDSTAQDVVEHVRATLDGVTVASVRLFARVGVYDDVASFARTCGQLAAANECAVIPRLPTDRGAAMDNGDDYTERLQLLVAVSFPRSRVAGGTEQAAAQEMARLAGLIRKALLADRTRGGRCTAITFDGGGRVLDGTDCAGTYSPVAQRPNQAWYVFTVPAACGWTG